MYDGRELFVVVMKTAGDDADAFCADGIDESVFAVDPAAPESGEVSGEGFRLSQSFISIPVNVF